MKYRLIDHTADLGLHVFGADPSELFATAARAMFDIMVAPDSVHAAHSLKLQVEGADWPDLMVNWLREVLFLWNGERKLVESVQILSISEKKLSAKIFFDSYTPDRHIIRTEIKAVTYHQAYVKRSSFGWEAGIIFDI